MAAGRSDARCALLGFGVLLVALDALIPTDAQSSQAAERSVVDAAIAASDSEADALVKAIEDVAARLDLRVRVERRQDRPSDSSWPDDVLAGVWIDARARDRIEIRMTSLPSGPTSRSFERFFAREGSTAVVVEDVAQVVRAALESMQANQTEPEPTPPSATVAAESSTQPPGPPAVAAPVASTPAPMPRFGLDFMAFGSERAMSARSGPVLGVGAAFGISFDRAPGRPGAWISAAYGSRFDAQSGPVTFDVNASSFRLMPGVELLELDVMQVDVYAGGGVDLFRVAPLVVRGSQATFGATTRFVDPVVAGQLLVRLRLVSQIRMTFGFDADYDWAPHETPAPDDHPGGPHATFEPWLLRPALAVGLCIPLSKGGACANAR